MSTTKSVELSRRGLLRGEISGPRRPVRPPWALVEDEFTRVCDRCHDCVTRCPEEVIRSGSGGFPEMDFSQRGCSLCGECLQACMGKALRGDPQDPTPWSLTARILEGCLADQGVVCRSCGEACDERAIRFELRVGRAAKPHLDAERCNGCGYCVGVCPSQAIEVRPGETQLAGSVAGSARHQEIGTR